MRERERVPLSLFIPFGKFTPEPEALSGVFTITDKRAEQALKIAI